MYKGGNNDIIIIYYLFVTAHSLFSSFTLHSLLSLALSWIFKLPADMQQQ